MAPGRVGGVLERDRDHDAAAGQAQHLGEHPGAVGLVQVLDEVHGEHGVRAAVGQRDGTGVGDPGREPDAEGTGDPGEQVDRAGGQVGRGHPVAVPGQLQGQEPEAAAQLQHVRPDGERPRHRVHGGGLGVRPARHRGPGERVQGVAVEGEPGLVRIVRGAQDAGHERLLEAVRREQPRCDERAVQPAGEIVADPVGPDHRMSPNGQRPISSPAISFVVVSSPDRSRTTRTRSQYSA
ncbi:hypothetical protein AFB00_13710 [Pseudonocardia sp. HH130630-07]|nr:hypothetical protein AFB00_13710 [Pseudonocardia sp. HH130630-07]